MTLVQTSALPLSASSVLTDADADTSKATFVWTVTHGSYTCQVQSTKIGRASCREREYDSVTPGRSNTDSNCTGTGFPTSINPAKGDTVTVTVTPNDGSDDGTAKAASVTIVNTAPVASTPS